ncbi:MAG: protein-disulfide reductase DsbD domain-containing protein, partial [Thermoanaerobaculia bacterium]
MQILRILIFIFSLTLFAQDGEVLSFLKENSRVVLDKDNNFEATLSFKVSSGWHINANKIEDEFLIPTEIKVKEENIKIEEINYPEGKRIKLGFSKNPLIVYSGNFEIKIKGKIIKEIENFEGKITFQG